MALFTGASMAQHPWLLLLALAGKSSGFSLTAETRTIDDSEVAADRHPNSHAIQSAQGGDLHGRSLQSDCDSYCDSSGYSSAVGCTGACADYCDSSSYANAVGCQGCCADYCDSNSYQSAVGCQGWHM